MTISTTISRQSYNGNGVTTIFSVPFRFFADSDLVVQLVTISTGASTTLTLTTNYTVTGADSEGGGSLTMLVAPATGQRLVIRRVIPATQEVDYVAGDPFPAETHERALDRLTMLAQQGEEVNARALVFPAGDTASGELPAVATRASRLLGFDSSGNLVTSAPASGSAAELVIDLAGTGGAGLVGKTGGGTVQEFIDVAEVKQREIASITDFMTAEEIADFEAGTKLVNVAAKVQLAYDTAKTVIHPKGKAYLGRTAVTIPANTNLVGRAGFEFGFDSSTPALMPEAYFPIVGNNVSIEGIYLNMGASPFVAYTPSGIGWQLRNGVSNVRITKCRTTMMMHSVHGIHNGATPANGCSNIEVYDNDFNSADTDVYITGRSLTRCAVYNNRFAGTKPNYLRNGGAVFIAPAVALENPTVFNQTDYDTYHGDQIMVLNNMIAVDKGRTIRVHNSKRVAINGNVMKLAKNTYVGQLAPDDVVTMDMLRSFTCNDNIIEGGGENSIDFLSCHDGVISDNIIKQNDTIGIYGYVSDLWVVSGSSPKLSGVTDRTAFQNKNIVVSNNQMESWVGVYVGLGQNILVDGNLIAPYRGTTNRTSAAGAPLPLVLNILDAALYFAESEAHWPDNIVFKNNQPILIGPVRVVADAATDTFTTVGSVPHRFSTGDKVEPIAGGSSNTVDFPAGLDFKTEYFVIRTSDTAFQLATSWANAFANTAVNITTNGLTVTNSRLYFEEARPNTGVNVDATYYTPRQRITLDKNIPGYSAVNLFSTFPVINPGVALLMENVKHEYVVDPARDYGVARDTMLKYFPVPALASDGSIVYGLGQYSIRADGYQYAIGARPVNTLGSPTDGYIKTTIW